jgi:hypothetical protein
MEDDEVTSRKSEYTVTSPESTQSDNDNNNNNNNNEDDDGDEGDDDFTEQPGKIYFENILNCHEFNAIATMLGPQVRQPATLFFFFFLFFVSSSSSSFFLLLLHRSPSECSRGLTDSH